MLIKIHYYHILIAELSIVDSIKTEGALFLY